jgi:hypothetical protein
LSKLILYLYRGKKKPKNVCYFCNFYKNRPQLTLTHWANIRPIWSPCLWARNFPVGAKIGLKFGLWALEIFFFNPSVCSNLVDRKIRRLDGRTEDARVVAKFDRRPEPDALPPAFTVA